MSTTQAKRKETEFAKSKNSKAVSYKLVDSFADESSIGMSPRRVTDVGRRLLYGACEDEKMAPFFEKPGYSWGVSIRTTPKDWH